MKVNVNGKNKFEVKPKLREYLNQKIEGLSRMFRDSSNLTAQVVCKEYGDQKVVEITIPTKHLILRAEGRAEDMFMAIDNAYDKIETQLIKHKRKINSIIKKRDGVANYFSDYINSQESTENDKKIVKEKTLELDVMSVDEAITQLELLGHDFYMFINEENHKVSTVYLRNDGDYAVIRIDK